MVGVAGGTVGRDIVDDAVILSQSGIQLFDLTSQLLIGGGDVLIAQPLTGGHELTGAAAPLAVLALGQEQTDGLHNGIAVMLAAQLCVQSCFGSANHLPPAGGTVKTDGRCVLSGITSDDVQGCVLLWPRFVAAESANTEISQNENIGDNWLRAQYDPAGSSLA